MTRRSLIALLFAAWATAQLFDGPIRYSLVMAGLPSLLYLRDLLMVAALALAVREFGFGRPLGATIAAIGAAALAGLIQGRSAGQVGFALKITVPLLFGVTCGDHLPPATPGRRVGLALWLALAVVAAGVFLNQVIEWPWEGLEYALEGVSSDIKSSKVWSTMGVKRISGFSRSSYDAAVALAILAVAVTSRYRNPILSAVALALAAAATVVTTTKGILLNLSIVSVSIVVSLLSETFERRVLVPMLSAVLVGAIFLLPIQSFSSKPIFDTSTDDKAFLLKSMNDRFESCWPEAFDLIMDEGNLMTGRGLGGLGIPQLYFESEKYNPCDNLMIYLIGNYGIFSVLLLPGLGWRVAAMARADGVLPRFLAMSGLLFLSYGMTTNVLESPFLSLVVGLILSRADGPRLPPLRLPSRPRDPDGGPREAGRLATHPREHADVFQRNYLGHLGFDSPASKGSVNP